MIPCKYVSHLVKHFVSMIEIDWMKWGIIRVKELEIHKYCASQTEWMNGEWMENEWISERVSYVNSEWNVIHTFSEDVPCGNSFLLHSIQVLQVCPHQSPCEGRRTSFSPSAFEGSRFWLHRLRMTFHYWGWSASPPPRSPQETSLTPRWRRRRRMWLFVAV